MLLPTIVVELDATAILASNRVRLDSVFDTLNGIRMLLLALLCSSTVRLHVSNSFPSRCPCHKNVKMTLTTAKQTRNQPVLDFSLYNTRRRIVVPQGQ